SWLINPGKPIPKELTELHGIDDAMVKDKPSFAECIPRLCEWLSQCAFVGAYHSPFDRDFLTEEFKRANHPLPEVALRPWVDPLVWVRHYHKYEKRKTVEAMCKLFGISLERAHRASHD